VARAIQDIAFRARVIMSTLGPLVLTLAGAYAVIGVCAGVVFLLGGYRKLLAAPAPVTWPARLLLTPGAMLLWPLIVKRWRQNRAATPATESSA
jgi:hypothetical protein